MIISFQLFFRLVQHLRFFGIGPTLAFQVLICFSSSKHYDCQFFSVLDCFFMIYFTLNSSESSFQTRENDGEYELNKLVFITIIINKDILRLFY